MSIGSAVLNVAESTAVNVILPLIEHLLPLFGVGGASAGTIGVVIKGLQTVIPLIGPLASNLVPKIKNIIEIVSSDAAVTPEQLATLRKLDAESDAAFDAALAAAEAEDAKDE